MRSRWRWAASKARSIRASRALGNSRNLPRENLIRRSTAGLRCSAPAASAARRPAPTCSRAALPRSITSRAASSGIWSRCRQPKAAGAVNVSCSMSALRWVTDYANAQWNDPPMSDVQELSDRIDALEARLTFQDVTIETLNQTITAQWLEIDALTRKVASLSERLREAEANVPGPANEPPPHY